MANNTQTVSDNNPLLKNCRNEYLFSERYLRNIISRSSGVENLKSLLQTIAEWEEYSDGSSLVKWMDSYIGPVLDTLEFGHSQSPSESPNVFLLHPDVSTTEVISLCYVIPMGEDIDSTSKGRHWAEKIIRLLREHGFKWGILTDGLVWRIYHTEEATPYETYIESDLESVVEDQDHDAFQIFHFFFQPDNFVARGDGECKLDDFQKESLKTTEYIEKNLSEAIEREQEGGQGILQTLCLGYLDFLEKSSYSDEDRQLLYGSSILYLFRLLFLFYSASRNLLANEKVEEFNGIVQNAYLIHNEGGTKLDSFQLWKGLQSLFADIELTYDGGLFNLYESDKTQFIEENRIADPYLSEVIFGLAYYEDSKKRLIPTEYRDLSVRHLGSLYEGILEHNLFIAEEDIVVRKSGSKVKFVEKSRAGKIRRNETIIEKGKVYFSEDENERKITGSYYTPEDVVEYIVKNSVDELLKKKKGGIEDRLKPVVEELNTSATESGRKRMEALLDDKVLEFIEKEVLSLSVLDNTMGSGHFLVNATNHIANFIVELLNDSSGCNPEISTDPAYWRRRVVENCIYGVDLNPLAVELAKLCLWITTAAKEKPLSFLNHHLKRGNALVGTRFSDIEEYFHGDKNETVDLFKHSLFSALKNVAKSYQKKLSKLTESRRDIDEKKEILSNLQDELAPYKYWYDLFTLYRLGEVNESDLQTQLENWRKGDPPVPIKTAQEMCFFHWDLEFPDVFYDGDEAGFSCVIGNPPYVERRELHYSPMIANTLSCGNTYAFLMESNLLMLKDTGQFAHIVPMSAISTDRMKSLQDFLVSNSTRINIANFAVRPSKIFPTVDMNVSIIHGEKGKSNNQNISTTGYIRWYSEERKTLFEKLSYTSCKELVSAGVLPKLGNDIDKNLFRKLTRIEKSIYDYVDSSDNGKKLYYHSGGRYWRKALKAKISSQYKALQVTESAYYPILCILNSSLYYWYWITVSACYHLANKDVVNFPFDIDHAESQGLIRFKEFGEKLMKDYEHNANIKMRTKGGQVFEEKSYYPVKSKTIIDQIDCLVGCFYNLTESEIEYVCNFESRFRMGKIASNRN